MRLKLYIVSLWIFAGFTSSVVDAQVIYSDFIKQDPVEIKKEKTDQNGQPQKQETPPEVDLIFRYATAFSPRLLKGQSTQADIDRYLAILEKDPNEMELISLLLTMTAKNQKLRESLMNEFKKMVDADPGLPHLAVITAERFFLKKDYVNTKKYISLALPHLTNKDHTKKIVAARDIKYRVFLSAITKYMDSTSNLNHLDDFFALENTLKTDESLSKDPELLVHKISSYAGVSTRHKNDLPISYFAPDRKNHAQDELNQLLDRYADAWTDPASIKVFSTIKDELHLNVMGIMNKQKRLDRLNVNLQKFHKAHPNHRLVMYMLAGIFTVQDKHVEAAKMWKNFLHGQRKPSPDLYQRYAEALRRAKNFKEALKVYDALLVMTPVHLQIKVKIDALNTAWEGKLYKEALQRIDKFFRRTDTLYYQLQIMTHMQNKDRKSAYASVKNALKSIHAGRIKMVAPAFWILCADIAEKNKDLKLMEEILLDQLKKVPKNTTVKNILAYAYANNNIKLQEAKKLLTEALQEKPDAPEIMDSMAWTLYKLKEYEEAKKYILRSLELYKKQGKEDAVLLSHAGDIFFAAGDKKQACEYWKRAIQKFNPKTNSEDIDVKELQRKIDSVNKGK